MSRSTECVSFEVDGLSSQIVVAWEDGDIMRRLTHARKSQELLSLQQMNGELIVIAPERVVAVHVSAPKREQLSDVLGRLTVARAFSELTV